MRIVLYGIVIVAVVALLGAAAYVAFGSGGDIGGGPAVAVVDPAEIDATAIAFVQNPYTDDYDMTRIAGYLQNLSEKTIASASIEIQLLGKDGGKDELIKYEVLDVPPGSRKSFDANAGSISGPRTSEVTIVALQVKE
jgi:hypothetical protein